ncbi:MAG TPA: chemotaxis protein CheA [Thermodesulfobacteriota bacterium]|nr:chemotaxis protein CheA [Thermodesulfobacteriota bacterium]
MVKNRDKRSERFKEFLAEAEDILNSMARDLVRLGKGVKAGIIDPTVLNNVFRSAHTLKGVSGIFEFKNVSDLSHSLEDTLDMLRLGRTALTDDVLDSVMSAHELLVKIVASKGDGNFNPEVSHLKTLLARTLETKKPAAKAQIDKEILSALTEYEGHRLRENLKEGRNILVVNVKFPVTSFDKSYEALIETLKNDAELIATLPSSGPDPGTLYFELLVGTLKDSPHIADLVKGFSQADIRVLKGPSAKAPVEESRPLSIRKTAIETLRRDSSTVRVDIEKLDHIMNIVSELGILTSSVARLSAELKSSASTSVYGIELSRVEKYLERKFSELRDSVLDVRMVPIGRLFGRFEAFIERLAKETGKEIRMVTNGDDTEIDKLIVEELADPLMHIIRNVIDHGIEAPEERERFGKPRIGAVTLSAHQKGNHVVVEVKDDGRGMDEEFIRRKAVEKGIVNREFIGRMSRQEILDLIFIPGFTTADKVSVTSGRGVGLDVVKENITRQSGIIDVDTLKGRGTRFILTIPITLAIIPALLIEAGRERYALPLSSVLEIIELDRDVLGREEVLGFVKLKKRKIPCVRLSEFFGSPPSGSDGGACYGVIAGLASHRLCVIVDSLLEELDVVIKPLPDMLNVPGVAGATDMGEKGTVLVLDVTGILEYLLNNRKVFKKAEPLSL